jgi:hypothetical protein
MGVPILIFDDFKTSSGAAPIGARTANTGGYETTRELHSSDCSNFATFVVFPSLQSNDDIAIIGQSNGSKTRHPIASERS